MTTPNDPFKALSSRWMPLIESALDRFLAASDDAGDLAPRADHAAFPHRARVLEAMRYSVMAGGKRLRPLLVLLACDAAGGATDDALPTAAAFEMVHTYSLIHDDLPAMDDDDLRRGRPTNHKVYGEALAILAGDALLTRAFEVIARFTPKTERVAALVCELGRGAGASGMVLGQVADLAGEAEPPRAALVEYIHRHKTGALFVTAIRAGAIAGGANADQLRAFTRYGESLGLAFQIVDDILDETATPEQMGKATKKDSGANKQTWPAVFGLDASRKRAAELVADARAAVANVKNPAPLMALADFFEKREN